MQHSPQELKERLLKALDKDYNVVDMPMVLEVFTSLEKFPITRENLEQTRLGRHVNDLRRKTSDKDLSKRAKQLVRKWQKLLQATNSASVNQTVNGEGIASDGVGGGAVKGPVASLVSGLSRPSSPCSRPGTPSSARSNVSPLNNTRMQSVCSVSSSRSDTPPVQHKVSRHSPKLSSLGLTSTSQPSSPALAAYHTGAGDQTTKLPPQRSIPPHVNAESSFSSRPGTPTDPLSKTNVANMRKRRLEESSPPLGEPQRKQAACDSSLVPDNVSPQLPSTSSSSGIKVKIKHERTVNGLVSHTEVKVEGIGASHNGHEVTSEEIRTSLRESPTLEEPSLSKHKGALSCDQQMLLDRTSNTNTPDKWGTIGNKNLERTASLTPKTPKVKTTAQLIKELHETGQVTLRATPTVTRIAMNQIEKEDDGDESVVPAGARPRPRRRNCAGIHPPIHSDKSLSQTKNERIQSFLRTAVTPSPGPPQDHDSDLSNLLKLKLQPDMSEDVDVESPLTIPQSPSLHGSHKVNGGFSQTRAHASDVHDGHIPDTSGQAPPSCDSAMIRDPWSHLPPLDLEAIDWSEPPSPPPPEEVNEASVNRLHDDHWPGVNGRYDSSGVWHDWTRCMSVTTYGENLLHILPYVDIDG